MAAELIHPNRVSRIFRLGIRQKVVLVLVTVLFTALTISGWLALQNEKRNIISEVNNRGEYLSRFVAGSLVYGVVGYDYHTLQLLLDEITISDEIRYAKVINKKGNVMAEAGVPSDLDSGEMAMFYQDITLDDESVGQLTMGLSLKNLTQRLESQKFSLLTREAIVILLIVLGEFIALSYVIIRPVRTMSLSLQQNIDTDENQWGDLPVMSNDEFGLLAGQFNELQRQLKEANGLLQSKIDLADEKLKATNNQLMEQSMELQKINQEFKLLSVTDPLTSLYNRRHFEDLIETEIAMCFRHGDVSSLIMIDIDHFKNINDTWGHFAGDLVLKELASVLRHNIRKTDIVCRLGGEEFVILSKRAGKAEAVEVAEKLRVAVQARKITLNQDKLSITISLGIATIHDKLKTKSLEDFYRCADTALYVSKDSGRNQVTHYDDTIG